MKENILSIMAVGCIVLVAFFLLCNQSVSVDIEHKGKSSEQQKRQDSGALSKNLDGRHSSGYCSGGESSGTVGMCRENDAAFPAGSPQTIYARPVGVASEAYRQAQMRADSDHARAIMAAQNNLGDAAFERVIHQASVQELARIRGNLSFASR